MEDIFTPRLHLKVRPNGILVKHHKTIIYDTKSLKTLAKTSYTKFKEYIDSRCNVCMKFESISVKTCARKTLYIG